MQLQLFTEGVSLTDEDKEYITKKILHLEKFAHELLEESTSVRVDVRANKVKTSDKNVSVQVTLFVHPSILRAEDFGVTSNEAIDLVEGKLRKQIERYKGKHHRRAQGGEWIPESTLEQLSGTQDDLAPMTVSKVAKRKKISDIQSMHEDEAIEQLELLGHDFFVFDNKDTGLTAVAYKRKDDTYGVIEVSEFSPENS